MLLTYSVALSVYSDHVDKMLFPVCVLHLSIMAFPVYSDEVNIMELAAWVYQRTSQNSLCSPRPYIVCTIRPYLYAPLASPLYAPLAPICTLRPSS